MKKTVLYYRIIVTTIVLLIVLLGCTKKLDRYRDPDWLGGESIKTLEDGYNGKKFTMFLQLMDRSKNRSTIDKQLSTLFVPDDDAFKKFLQDKNIASIDCLSVEQASEIFNLHYLAKPRNANLLVYEKAWNRLESATGEYGSYFFRKPTVSLAPPFLYVVPKNDKTLGGQTIYITTGYKYVPLFSKIFFHDFNGDAEVDYPFMYPDSKWGGLFQWHSATILPPEDNPNTTNIEDLAHPTASGFIYYIDRVVDAIPSIEQYLIAHHDQYGLFYDLMQRFGTYPTSTTDRQGRKLYTKGYTGISNIASEGGPTSGEPMGMSNIYTVFLPDNNLLQAYLDKTVLQIYPKVDSVPNVMINQILQSQMTNRLELKSKFTKRYISKDGDISVIDANDVEPGFMCSNGIIYKSKKILEPNVFLSVPGKLYFDKKYSTFLTMLTDANTIKSLSGTDRITLFAATNDDLADANIRMGVNIKGTPEVQLMSDQNNWYPMSADEKNEFVMNHIYDNELTDLTGEQFIEMRSHNYIRVSNGVVSGGLNDYKNISPTEVQGFNTKNGKLYYISSPIQTKYRTGQYIMKDTTLSEFTSMMILTGVLDITFTEKITYNAYPVIPTQEKANAFYLTLFAPDNAAVRASLKNGMPDTTGLWNKTDNTKYGNAIKNIKDFVTYHFVSKTIFDDGKKAGVFKTNLANYNIYITNNVGNMVITDATGNAVTLDHSNANHVVRRGVVHKITSVLKYK
jgi:hypothetical protein